MPASPVSPTEAQPMLLRHSRSPYASPTSSLYSSFDNLAEERNNDSAPASPLSSKPGGTPDQRLRRRDAKRNSTIALSKRPWRQASTQPTTPCGDTNDGGGATFHLRLCMSSPSLATPPLAVTKDIRLACRQSLEEAYSKPSLEVESTAGEQGLPQKKELRLEDGVATTASSRSAFTLLHTPSPNVTLTFDTLGTGGGDATIVSFASSARDNLEHFAGVSCCPVPLATPGTNEVYDGSITAAIDTSDINLPRPPTSPTLSNAPSMCDRSTATTAEGASCSVSRLSRCKRRLQDLSTPAFDLKAVQAAQNLLLEEEEVRNAAQCDPISDITALLSVGTWKDASDPALLKRHHIRYVLNVAEELIPSEEASRIAHNTDIIAASIPMKDSHSQDISEHLTKAFRFIERARRDDSRVLVHCRRGISRSAAIAVAYLMASEHRSYEEALRVVTTRRHCVSLNLAFQQCLSEYVPSPEFFHSESPVSEAFLSPRSNESCCGCDVASAATVSPSSRREPQRLDGKGEDCLTLECDAPVAPCNRAEDAAGNAMRSALSPGAQPMAWRGQGKQQLRLSLANKDAVAISPTLSTGTSKTAMWLEEAASLPPQRLPAHTGGAVTAAAQALPPLSPVTPPSVGSTVVAVTLPPWPGRHFATVVSATSTSGDIHEGDDDVTAAAVAASYRLERDANYEEQWDELASPLSSGGGNGDGGGGGGGGRCHSRALMRFTFAAASASRSTSVQSRSSRSCTSPGGEGGVEDEEGGDDENQCTRADATTVCAAAATTTTGTAAPTALNHEKRGRHIFESPASSSSFVDRRKGEEVGRQRRRSFACGGVSGSNVFRYPQHGRRSHRSAFEHLSGGDVKEVGDGTASAQEADVATFRRPCSGENGGSDVRLNGFHAAPAASAGANHSVAGRQSNSAKLRVPTFDGAGDGNEDGDDDDSGKKSGGSRRVAQPIIVGSSSSSSDVAVRGGHTPETNGTTGGLSASQFGTQSSLNDDSCAMLSAMERPTLCAMGGRLLSRDSSLGQ